MRGLVPWLAAIVAFAALLVVLVITLSGDERSAAPSEVESLVEAPPAAARGGAEAAIRADQAIAQQARSVATPEAPPDTAVAPSSPPERAAQLVVRVVDEGGKPVEGALVDLFASLGFGAVGRIEEQEVAWREGREPPQRSPILSPHWCHTRGTARALTDAGGRARLPRALAGQLVAVVDGPNGASHGTLAVNPAMLASHLELVLEVAPVPTWDVRVLDAEGEPASQVAVVLVVDEPPPGRGRLHENELVGGTTDASGSVRLFDPSRRAQLGTRARLRAIVHAREPVEAEIPAPGQVATLRLPPTGSVTVELPPGLAGTSVILWHGTAHASTGIVAGRAHFARVGLGLVLAAESKGSFGTRGDDFAGPTAIGEEIVHRLQPRAGVALTVVDADGVPLADRMLLVQWTGTTDGADTSPRVSRTVYSATAAEGRLLLSPLGVHISSLSLGALARDEAGHARRVEASLDMPPRSEWTRRVVDLGTVRLEPVPLLAAGRVVDPSGTPIPGAVAYSYDIQLDRISTMDPIGVVPVKCDERGRFALDVDPDVPTPKLFAWAPGYIDSPGMPLVRGSADHVVTLEPAARLMLTVALDTAERHRDIEVSLVRDRTSLRPQAAPPGEAERAYGWEDVAPGDWTIVVRMHVGGEPLHELPVRLVAGENSDAGRIDLGGALDTSTLSVLDASGAPLDAYRWRVVSGRSRGPWAEPGSPTLVPHPPGGGDVEVHAVGYFSATTPIDRRSLEVRLRTAPPARLRLPDGFPAPAEGALTLHLVRVDDLHVGAMIEVSVDSTNRCVAPLLPGRWHAVALAAARVTTCQFDVTEADLLEERSVELGFDLDEWSAAIGAR